MENIEKTEQIIANPNIEEWNLDLLNDYMNELKKLENTSATNILQLLILYRSQIDSKILTKAMITKQSFNWENLFQIELNIIELIYNMLKTPKLISSSYFFYALVEIILYTIKFGFDAEKGFKDFTVPVPSCILHYTDLLKKISIFLKSSEMDNLIQLSEGSLNDLKENYEGLCLITNVYIELIPITSYYSAKLAPTYLGLKHCLNMLSEIENWDYNELRFIDLILNIGYQIHEETPHSDVETQTKQRDLSVLSHHIAHLIIFIRDFKTLYWEIVANLVTNKHSQLTREFPTWIRDIIGYALENSYYRRNENETQGPLSTLYLRIKKLASVVILPPPTLAHHLYLEILNNFINAKTSHHHHSLVSLYIIKTLLESTPDTLVEAISHWNPFKVICGLIDEAPQEYSVIKNANYDSEKLMDIYDQFHWANLLSRWIFTNPSTLRSSFICSLELISSVRDRGWELLLITWPKIYSFLPENYQNQIFKQVLKLTPNFWASSNDITRLQLLINEFSKYMNPNQILLAGNIYKKCINLVLTKQSQEAMMTLSIFPISNLSLYALGLDQEPIFNLLNWTYNNIDLFLSTQQHFNLLTKVLINLNSIKTDDNNDIQLLLRAFDKHIFDYTLLYAPDSKYMMYGDGSILVQGARYFYSIPNLPDSESIDLLNNVSQWLDFESDLLNEFIFLKLSLKLITKSSTSSNYKSQSLFYAKNIVESYLLVDDWASQLYVFYNIYIACVVGFKSIMPQITPPKFKPILIKFLTSVAKPDSSIIEQLTEFENNQFKDKKNSTQYNCAKWFQDNPIVNYPDMSIEEVPNLSLEEFLINSYKLEKMIEYLNLSTEGSKNLKEKLKTPLKKLKTKLN